MSVVTIFAPNFYITGIGRNEGLIVEMFPVVKALVWTFSPESNGGFQLLTPSLLLQDFSLTFPQILIVILVVRYCQGKRERKRNLAIALLLAMSPMIFGISRMLELFLGGYLIYSGIIPIQIIVAYLFIRFKGKPEESPWDD